MHVRHSGQSRGASNGVDLLKPVGNPVPTGGHWGRHCLQVYSGDIAETIRLCVLLTIGYWFIYLPAFYYLTIFRFFL
jgi:hypothetical protein